MLIAIAGVLLVPKVLQLTNRVLEEYVIPRKIIKSGADVYPLDFSVALTKKQLEKLDENGSIAILSQGAHLRARIEEAIKARAADGNA